MAASLREKYYHGMTWFAGCQRATAFAPAFVDSRHLMAHHVPGNFDVALIDEPNAG